MDVDFSDFDLPSEDEVPLATSFGSAANMQVDYLLCLFFDCFSLFLSSFLSPLSFLVTERINVSFHRKNASKYVHNHFLFILCSSGFFSLHSQR